MNKTQKLGTQIPGTLYKSYNCSFGNRYGYGGAVGVYLVEVDAKRVEGADGLLSDFSGAYTNEDVVVSTPTTFQRIPENSIVVFCGKKAFSRFKYGSKQFDIITMYEAAKCFYTALESNEDVMATVNIEEKAVAWLAALAKENGYWKSTVFDALYKYDRNLRRYESKYFNKVKKEGFAVQQPNPAEVEEFDEILDAMTA